jgi:multidrug resistance efflux pump
MRGLALFLLCTAAAVAQQMPQRDATGTASNAAELFVAPPLVLEATELPAAAPTEAAVARAKKERDWAKAKAERWARLQRSGVLSKVEVERATRSASQSSMRYQQLHAAQLRQQLADLRARPAHADLIATAEAALLTAEKLAAEAEAAWKKMEVALAETNLARRRALARSGLGSKTELRRAKSEVARLRGGL